MSEQIAYRADYGDWVRMADGRPGTVVRTNPAYGRPPGAEESSPGVYYEVMFKGGWEETYYEWDAQPGVLFKYRATEPVQPFTVVSQEA